MKMKSKQQIHPPSMFSIDAKTLTLIVLIGAAVAALTGCAREGSTAEWSARVTFGDACEKTYENEGGTGPIPGQGMSQPWEEIQAEDAQISGGLTIGPCRTKWDARHIEAEAIGRKAVVLQRTGDSVKFRPDMANADSIVVRYSVPDSPGGGGADYTLGLYRNGSKIASLTLSSKHSWNYLGETMDDPATDVPGPQPHTFFDEVRFIDPHPRDGADWELRRDGSDTAEFYVIDLADFEKVPPPGSMPEGFTNVETLGIHPNDGIDHALDIERVLLEASQHVPQLPPAKLYFPPGTYIVESFNGNGNEGLDCKNCDIRGAGMWHTNFVGRRAMFFCLSRLGDANGGNTEGTACNFSDFSITGTTTQRNERIAGPQKGFAGPMGTAGSTISRVWIEHVVAGIWVGNDPPNQPAATRGLTIDSCRVRNVYADGINLANGTSGTTVKNTHIRNSGDDGIALWSVQWTKWVRDTTVSKGADFIVANARGEPDQGQESGNLIENVSVQMPWRAGCFSVYGGAGHTFQNLTCEDVLTYPGILVDNEFSSYAFGPAVTTFRNITLKRAGGAMFYENTTFPWVHGALKFYKKEGDVANILVDGVNIISPTYSGIEFRGFGDQFVQNGEKYSKELLASANTAAFRNITLQNVTVSNPGTQSINILQNGPLGSVNLGPGINIPEPYIFDPEPIPQGWPGFFQGTSYPWTSLTSNPVLDWQQAFCDRLSAHRTTCSSEGESSPGCGQDPASSCAAYAAIYNAATMNAAASCAVDSDCNGPMMTSPCVREALRSAALSPAQTGLASDYCGRCAANDGQTLDDCTAGFWNDATGGRSGPGALALGSSDALVARIDSVCVGSGTCGDFEACAANALDAAAPVESATCHTTRDLFTPAKVIVLGDSLSDQDNQWSFQLSGQTPSPAKGYWNGRFTNGFNWVDYMIDDNPILGRNRLVNASVGGGFASLMGQRLVLAPLGVRPTLDEEIEGLPVISARDYYNSVAIIWTGANDVNTVANKLPAGISAQNIADAIADSIEAGIKKLANRGVRHFVIANLPPLERVPVARQPDAAGGGYEGDPARINLARDARNIVNRRLAEIVTHWNDGIIINASLVDMAGFIESMLDGVQTSINMYQVTYACRNQEATGPFLPESYQDAPCPGYMFFDNLHPTTLAHCGLAQQLEGRMQRIGIDVVRGGEDFDKTCPRRVQNGPWDDKGYHTPRPAQFYARTTLGRSPVSRICSLACPGGTEWAGSAGPPLPGWFSIAGIPGGTQEAGIDGVTLAPGWSQPGTPPEGAIGGCLCVSDID